MQLVGFQYEPWLLFRNPEHHGRFLNTDAHGFRRTRRPQQRCAEPVRIFVFGGSTTFGDPAGAEVRAVDAVIVARCVSDFRL